MPKILLPMMRFSKRNLKSSVLYCTILTITLVLIHIMKKVEQKITLVSYLRGTAELMEFRLHEQINSFGFNSNNTSVIPLLRLFVKELPYYKHRMDSRSTVNIYDWMWTGHNWDAAMNFIPVCLATQGSMDRLHSIMEMSQNWRGPISLAIYITSPEEWIGLNIVVNYFKLCSQPFRDYVSIHVAIPLSVGNWKGMEKWATQIKLGRVHQLLGNTSCQTPPKKLIEQIHKIFPARKNLLSNYPQNILRNIAKQACGMHWTFSIDIDIIPVPNGARLLKEFIMTDKAKSCSKCAFVIPTFELSAKHSFPKSKAELVEHWTKKEANPFHYHYFPPAHQATDYKRWKKSKGSSDQPQLIKIAYDVITSNKTMYYEPFFLSRNTVPEYPERFTGYGFTRSSLIQEALFEGWKFKVLTPIFAIHWGLQNNKTILSPGNDINLRKSQTYKNALLFVQFRKELAFRKKLKKKK